MKERMSANDMSVAERVKAPTPKFFKVLRTVGLVLAAISGTLLAAPIALPVAMVTVITYMGVAGAMATAISQLTVDDEKINEQK